MSEGVRDERTQSAGQRGDRATTEPIQNPTYTTPTGDVVALRLQLQLAETQLELERAKKRNAADAELSSRRNSEEEEEAREESRGSPEGSDTRRPAFDAKEYLLMEPPYISPKERAILSRQERNFSPQEVRDYVGGSVAAAQAFIRGCETVFRTQPHIYYYQHDKYMYAVSRFRGPVQSNWPAKERQLSDHELTWINLRRWILDREQDPHNRSITFALRLFCDKMSEGQKVESYITHLENAEMEIDMEEMTEAQKCYLLIAGVTPTLRNKLMEQQHIPLKRAELVPLLTRLEQNLHRRTDKPKALEQRNDGALRTMPYRGRGDVVRGRPDRGSGFQRRDYGAAMAPPRRPAVVVPTFPVSTPATGVNTIRGNCHNCGLPGHWMKECPKNGKP